LLSGEKRDALKTLVIPAQAGTLGLALARSADGHVRSAVPAARATVPLVSETAPGFRPGGRVTYLLVQISNQQST
jgi:hypothetical protein